MIESAIVLALCATAVAAGSCGAASSPADQDAQAILALERGAFDRWAKGDPQGFVEISDPEVDYFDPFLEARLVGVPALRARYESYTWPVVDRWEMINPRVLVSGDMGVLTFNFVSYVKGLETRWNTTEVYRRK